MFRGSLLLSLLILLVPTGSAVALGLGDIHLASGLNQPLSADIELLATSHEELARLTAALASRDTFQHLGVDRPSFLSTVTFRVIEDGAGHATLRVRSSETFTEPFVDLVVDLSWPGGKLIRDYTLLLDPPGTATASESLNAGAVAPKAADLPANDATRPRSIVHSPPPVPVAAHGAAEPATVAADSRAPRTYTVVVGDTLDRISRHLGVHGRARRARMAEALIAANPEAFAAGVRHLEPGTTLTVPAATRARAATTNAGARTTTPAHDAATHATVDAPARTPGAAPPAATTAAQTHERAPAAVDSAALAALTQRVETLEKALAQASETQVREHAELLALREEVADAAIEARLHSSGTATRATRDAPPAPAEAQPPPPTVDDSEPALPAYVAPPAPATASATQADEPETPTRAARLRARLGAIAVAATVVLVLFYGLRALLRRRALKAALDELDADARGYAGDGRAPMRAGDDHDALWMRTHDSADEDATGPPGTESHAEPEHHIDVDSVPTKYDMDTSYLTALEHDIATGETVAPAPAPATATADPGDGTHERAHGHAADLPHESAIESTIIRQLEDKDVSPDMLILEPDFTSTDMELTSRRYDHTSDNERRSNGTDALKDALRVAITREPDRIDLRVKLLEVYYATAVANNLAFYELASALSRERELLPAEEHVRIAAMQRAIAAAPARQAEVATSDDLADCA